MKAADLKLTRFKGLDNVSDPLDVPFGYLTTADNINITRAGKITARNGYDLDTAGTIGGTYATIDHQRMYYMDSGSLKVKDGPTLSTGLSTDPMYWCEVNEQVYFNNGVDSGVINPDNSLIPWTWLVPGAPELRAVTGSLAPGKYDVCCTYVFPDGRETGNGDAASIELLEGQALQISGIPQASGMTTRTYLAPANSTVFQLLYQGTRTARTWFGRPDDLGIDLVTDGLDPIPAGATVVQMFKGRAYAAQYLPTDNMTAIWISQPLGFHLFDLSVDFVAVPGKVLMLAPTTDALIVGTDERIYAYSPDGTLTTLARYGVVPGWCWASDEEDQGTVFIWSVRGMCRAMPFVNLTKDHVSVAPGIQAGAAVIAQGGQKRFLVSLHAGGSSFNQRS